MANVVYVDDDPVARAVIHDVLVEGGHQVRIAETGAEMLRLLLEQPAEVLLLDVNIPGVSGDRLAKIVQKSLDPPYPKIVLFSGLPVADLRRLGRKLGATGFVHKGAQRKALLATVEAAAQLFASEVAGAPALTPAAPAGDETPLVRVVPEPIEG